MGGAVRTLVRVFSPDTIDRRRQEEKAFIDSQRKKLKDIKGQIDACQEDKNEIYINLSLITDSEGEVIPGNELIYQSLAGSLSTLNIHSNSLIASQGKLERLLNIYKAYEVLKPGDAKDEKIRKRLLANINKELKTEASDEKKNESETKEIENITESLADIATDITDSLAETYASTDAVLPPSSIPADIKRWKENQERNRIKQPTTQFARRSWSSEEKDISLFNDERLKPPTSLSASGFGVQDPPAANTRARVRRPVVNQEVY